MPSLKSYAKKFLRFCGLFPPAGRVMHAGPGRGLRFAAGGSNPAYETGENELPVQEALMKLMPVGGTFVDVGANVGFFSVIGGRLVGETGRVLAYEPVPENAAMVRANAAANGMRNISVHEVAVADRTGEGHLVLARYSGGSSLDFLPPPPDACGRLEVEMVRLDDHLNRIEPLQRLDLIKVDVEGAELAALSGMVNTLARWRPALIVEVDDVDVTTAAAKSARCRTWLSERGYDVRELESSYPDINWHVHHLLAEAVTGAGEFKV